MTRKEAIEKSKEILEYWDKTFPESAQVFKRFRLVIEELENRLKQEKVSYCCACGGTIESVRQTILSFLQKVVKKKLHYELERLLLTNALGFKYNDKLTAFIDKVLGE